MAGGRIPEGGGGGGGTLNLLLLGVVFYYSGAIWQIKKFILNKQFIHN